MRRHGPCRDGPARGQANLVAVGVALLILTTVAGMSLGLADGAFAAAERDAGERRVAVAVSERLVGAGSPWTVRSNVLNATALAGSTPAGFRRAFPSVEGYEVRVALDGEPLVAAGTPADGATIRRLVLVERRGARTIAPPLSAGVTLPRRTDRLRLSIDPPNGTRVRTVRASGRAVLHDPGGLSGNFTVELSRRETARITANATGPLPGGSVEMTYYPTETTKATLAVTVDG